MLQTRVIPCLLLHDGGLVKTIKFKHPTYVGDPINVVKIFNEKEVDELLLLDIAASRNQRSPDYAAIAEIVSECFMPVCYGGGVTTVDEIRKIFSLGVEKVSLNTAAIRGPDFVRTVADVFGSASVVVCIDVKKNILGRYDVYTGGGTKKHPDDPVSLAQQLERRGAGEILLNVIDRDGTLQGYDLPLLHKITSVVSVPVIALGGAGTYNDFRLAKERGGVSAVAAGSIFVFHGPHRAVLISYPSQQELKRIFQS